MQPDTNNIQCHSNVDNNSYCHSNVENVTGTSSTATWGIYDTETIQAVVEAVEIPVIACGGAGHNSHFDKCLEETDVSAVAAGNIFQFTESAYPRAKQYLRARRQDLR